MGRSAYKPYWIKFWIETLDDPKVQILSDHLWRRMIELFLIAGKTNEGGKLPPVEEMAWMLRVSIDQVSDDLQELSKVGCPGHKIIAFKNKAWWVVNFNKRQEPAPSVTRMKQYRERLDDRLLHKSNKNETKTSIKNVPDTETDRKTETNVTETESEPPSPTKPGDWIANFEATDTDRKIFTLPQGTKIEFTLFQYVTIERLSKSYGEDKVIGCLNWALKKGMTPGEAVIAAEKAVPYWTDGLAPNLNTPAKRIAYYTKLAEENHGTKKVEL
jgi:hypothetical protein